MTPGLPREAGWLERQFESAANDYAELPDWMKRKRGANPMTTLDDLLATSPTPWTSLQGIAFDCNGIIVPTSWGIVPNDMNALLVEAVNRIGELQRWQVDHERFQAAEAERDSLKSKVEELEAQVTMWTNSAKHWAACHDRLLSENADIECRCTLLEQALADKVIALTGVRKAQSDA